MMKTRHFDVDSCVNQFDPMIFCYETEICMYANVNAIVRARVKLPFVFQARHTFLTGQEGRRRVQSRKYLHVEDDRIDAAIFVVF